MAIGDKITLLSENDLGQPNGVAELDSNGKISEEQRPDIGAHAAAHASGGADPITPASIGAATAAEAFTVTLSAAGWSEYTQTVSDARFLASGYAYFTSPTPANFSAYGEVMIYADDVTVDGKMVFHCGEVPASDLVVNIFRDEVKM